MVNLWDVQGSLVALLQATTELAGVTVIADDGTFPKTPGYESALKTKGLVVVVYRIDAERTVYASANGVTEMAILVPVVVDENVKVNRTQGGTNISADRVIQRVLEGVCGKPASGLPFGTFYANTPPFKNFGVVNGIWRMVANIAINIQITPS